MTDPLSIIASTLTLADATRSVIAACSEYLQHAKNAPKDLQVLVEDLEDLNVTIKKLDEIAKSRWNPTQQLDDEFREWKVPLDRLMDHASRVKEIVDKQDLKLGVFHEMTFRALWPRAWKEIQNLLSKIDKEKDKLHFATAIEGVGIARKVYMLVENRLPLRITEPFEKPPFTWQQLARKEPLSYFLENLGPYMGWNGAVYEFPFFDDPHNRYVEACVNHSCDFFLSSPAYLGWKNRKTPGPSLINVTGSVGSGKSILCGQIVQDLQNSSSSDVGIAYCHCQNDFFDQTLHFYIMQLAFQAQCLPEDLMISGMSNTLKNPPGVSINLSTTGLLIALLESIIPKFRRVFLLLDDISFRMLKAEVVPRVFEKMLEQPFGNISIAVFRVPFEHHEQNLDIADVSIRLLKVEYRAEDLTKYVDWKLNKLIKPVLDFSKVNMRIAPDHRLIPTSDMLCMMRNAVISASDKLYLAADMFIDSILEFIQTHSRYEELEHHLHEIRESSEVMMQRDPEIMKQKEMIGHVPNQGEDYADDIKGSSLIRKRVPVGGGVPSYGADTKINAGVGSSHA